MDALPPEQGEIDGPSRLGEGGAVGGAQGEAGAGAPASSPGRGEAVRVDEVCAANEAGARASAHCKECALLNRKSCLRKPFRLPPREKAWRDRQEGAYLALCGEKGQLSALLGSGQGITSVLVEGGASYNGR